MFSLKRTLYPFIIPVVLIVVSSASILRWPDLSRLIADARDLRAILVIMPHVPYLVLAFGFVMGWRYSNAGMMLGTVSLGLAYFGFAHFRAPELSPEALMHQSATHALAFLLPLNLALCSGLIKRRILTSFGMLSVLLLALQIAAVVILYLPHSRISLFLLAKIGFVYSPSAEKLSSFSRWLGSILADQRYLNLAEISSAAAIAFGLALLYLLCNFFKSKDIRISGFFFATVAVLLGVVFTSSEPAIIFYFISAGLILVITSIEASFSMAYIDELTGLPGRRSLNETMLNLGRKYTIAMIDVDRFKKFNDTYGHKIGDQVLKMIASRLAKISGGAKIFRYGGEEFTAIFAGKCVDDAVAHIEKFREAVESTPFVVRGREGRRINDRKSGFSRKQVKVTVSIGLASPADQAMKPEKVMKIADRKLYKAKKAGRNRTVYK